MTTREPYHLHFHVSILFSVSRYHHVFKCHFLALRIRYKIYSGKTTSTCVCSEGLQANKSGPVEGRSRFRERDKARPWRVRESGLRIRAAAVLKLGQEWRL